MPAKDPAKDNVPSVKVSARAVKRLLRGHPWVYRSDLETDSTPPAALVHVQDARGKFIASALSSSSSQIALRVLTERELWSDAELKALVRERVRQALDYRKRMVRDSEGYRAIFSEADGLPGLIVDRYNDVLSMQVLTQAMDRNDLRAVVAEELVNGLGPEVSAVERVDTRIRQLESLLPTESRLVLGKNTSTIFSMNGLKFSFDALGGQKTGAFLDQRENYAAAAQYAFGEALDVFCYQGGFALHLARVCKQVAGVDASRAALETAEQNATLNKEQLKSGEIEWIEANSFDLLKDYSHPKSGKQYDTIVLDPPAFAKSKKSLPTALRGYKELNLRAMKMIRPDGILITNSCSHHLSEAEFGEMLASAASDAKRTLKILERRAQAKDHPIIATIPETAYLKCFICVVEAAR